MSHVFCDNLDILLLSRWRVFPVKSLCAWTLVVKLVSALMPSWRVIKDKLKATGEIGIWLIGIFFRVERWPDLFLNVPVYVFSFSQEKISSEWYNTQ